MGTLVSMSVAGLEAEAANKAIESAFEEIAAVHRLMSFHETSSDVSRLNREGALAPVAVHPYTFEVLHWAQRIAAGSQGSFDISVGIELVDWGILPSPSTSVMSGRASWRDIELLPDYRVFFHRPLWIDLGGIAKGYAVDKATERLHAQGVEHSLVNAGGDIRVQGRHAERIRLGVPWLDTSAPVLEVANASVASSSGGLPIPLDEGQSFGPHVDGRSRTPAPRGRFVCVVAESCLVADALTKVVMAEGVGSSELLQQYGAIAHIHDAMAGWQHFVREGELG